MMFGLVFLFILVQMLVFGPIPVLLGSLEYLFIVMVYYYILYFVLKIRKELKDL